MARSLRVLSERAHQMCVYRRHEMHRFSKFNEHIRVSHCKKCENVAILLLAALPGEIDIKGPAPYSYCWGRPVP